MKRMVLAGGCLLFALLAACESSLSVLPGDREEAVYSGTVRVALFGGHVLSDKPYLAGSHPLKQYSIQDRMAAFMEKHPNVAIEVVDLDPSVTTLERVMDDPALKPDIVELNVNEARAVAGRLVSLADRLEERRSAWAGDYEAVIASAEVDGEPYLLPVRSDPMIAYYDRSLFRTLGMPEPREGWALSEFAESAAALLQAGEFVNIPYELDDIGHFIRGWGGRYVEAGGRVTGVLDSDATTEAFVRYAQMMPSLGSQGDPKALDAMGIVRATSLRLLTREAYADYGVASVPSTLEGERGNTTRITGLAMTRDASQPELAWRLMAFVAGESSEEAMDFLVRNTLDVAYESFRTSKNASVAELRERMKREAAIAEPAAFDLFMVRPGYYDRTFPVRTPEEMKAYKNRETAKQDLTVLAGQLESWMALQNAK